MVDQRQPDRCDPGRTMTVPWDGPVGLESLLVPVGDLSEHPKNPRRGDVAKIAESLKTFGQVRPIVATKGGVVVAGNHTLKAAISIGWDKIAAVKVDLAEEEALAYLVADNRVADAGGYDNDVLGDVLAELQRDGAVFGALQGWRPRGLIRGARRRQR